MTVSRKVAASALAAVLACLPAVALCADDQADLVQEVTVRCIYDMGEFGDDAVQACMRADLAAAEALTGYPPAARGIVDRCTRALWTRGYAMVQVCVERDLAAEATLAAYGAEHAQAIAACRQRVGAQGPARVQACVDAAAAAPPPPQ